MTLPRFALLVALSLAFTAVSSFLIARPWVFLCTFAGGLALGVLVVRAK